MHPGMIHGVGGFGNAIAPTQGLAGRPSKFFIELMSIFFNFFSVYLKELFVKNAGF